MIKKKAHRKDEEFLMRQKVEDWLQGDKRVLLQGWSRAGLFAHQICENMGIGRTTFYKWINTNADFANIIKNNKDVCDFDVENELYKNAHGMKVTVKEPVKLKTIKYDKTTGKKISETEKVVLVEKEVYIKADTMAQMYWLNNRKPGDWRNKGKDIDKEITEENSGLIEIPAVMEAVMDDE